MADVIDKIFERISAYEFLNNIIPGTVYIVLTEKLTSFKIQTGNIWSDLVLYYFVGLLIGRIGSLVVEEFLKRINALKFASHSEYIEAEQNNSSVREQSSINNMYRTYTAVGLCLVLTVSFNFLWAVIKGMDWSRPALIVVACISIMLIFGRSYIKQTGYVASRVKTINKLNKESLIVLPEENGRH